MYNKKGDNMHYRIKFSNDYFSIEKPILVFSMKELKEKIDEEMQGVFTNYEILSKTKWKREESKMIDREKIKEYNREYMRRRRAGAI